MTTPRDDENFWPSTLRNSLDTTSVGSWRFPYGPGAPPLLPRPS
ncbi:Uncharacterised protein [Mycobacteroides abscessus]|nr:Uncharacterised protein [Mycobacteroides abscessus]